MVNPEAGVGKNPLAIHTQLSKYHEKEPQDHSFPMTSNPSRTAKAAIVSGSCFLNPRLAGGSLVSYLSEETSVIQGHFLGQNWQLEALSMSSWTKSTIVRTSCHSSVQRETEAHRREGGDS